MPSRFLRGFSVFIIGWYRGEMGIGLTIYPSCITLLHTTNTMQYCGTLLGPALVRRFELSRTLWHAYIAASRYPSVPAIPMTNILIVGLGRTTLDQPRGPQGIGYIQVWKRQIIDTQSLSEKTVHQPRIEQQLLCSSSFFRQPAKHAPKESQEIFLFAVFKSFLQSLEIVIRSRNRTFPLA